MFSREQISKMAFFDLETAANSKTLAEQTKGMQHHWSKRCEYLRDRYEDNKDMTDEELWNYKAGLHSEYNRIVCATFGRVEFTIDGPVFKVKSFYGTDENDIVNKSIKAVDKFHKNGYKLCGHNAKRFDIPVLCKRALINDVILPDFLHLHKVKPWEQPVVDTTEIWGFGSWQEGMAPLGLIMESLGLPTPKDDIDGTEVNGVYWNDGDVERIKTYCEKDVKALAQLILRLANEQYEFVKSPEKVA